MNQEIMERIAEGLIVAQSLALANQFILMEIVRDLARTQADPNRYLAGLFEKISARMDQSPLDQEKPVDAEMRDTIERFFAKARHRL